MPVFFSETPLLCHNKNNICTCISFFIPLNTDLLGMVSPALCFPSCFRGTLNPPVYFVCDFTGVCLGQGDNCVIRSWVRGWLQMFLFCLVTVQIWLWTIYITYMAPNTHPRKESRRERKNRDVYLIVRYPVLTVGNNLFHCPCHFL